MRGALSLVWMSLTRPPFVRSLVDGSLAVGAVLLCIGGEAAAQRNDWSAGGSTWRQPRTANPRPMVPSIGGQVTAFQGASIFGVAPRDWGQRGDRPGLQRRPQLYRPSGENPVSPGKLLGDANPSRTGARSGLTPAASLGDRASWNKNKPSGLVPLNPQRPEFAPAPSLPKTPELLRAEPPKPTELLKFNRLTADQFLDTFKAPEPMPLPGYQPQALPTLKIPPTP